MSLYGKLNPKARKAMEFARQSAAAMRHKYLGTEHLLLGLIKEARSDVPSLPDHITQNAVRETVSQLYARQDEPVTALELTPKMKSLIEKSIMTIQKNNIQYVTTPLLWMLLLEEGGSVAGRILAVFGCDTQVIRDEAEMSLQREMSGENSEDDSLLAKYGRDLTQMASDGLLDPVIGREKEIHRIVQILSRRTKNNPILIGEPGVGKSAAVEGLAQLMHEGAVPDTLRGKKLISLDVSTIVAGTKYRGEFEERMNGIVDEVRSQDNVMLFIDEIQMIVGAGKAEGSIDAAGILKPALARGEIQLIGATTINDYRKSIEKDSALSRRLQPVMVEEPTKEDSILILKGLRPKYEEYHNVKITDESIEAAVDYSARYINDRFLPDKAIDLIDEASSAKKIQSLEVPENIKEIQQDIEEANSDKKAAIEKQDYEAAAKMRDKEQKLKADLLLAKEEWEKTGVKNHMSINKEDIADVVSRWTGVPVTQMTKAQSERLLNLENELHKRIIGQDEAVSAVSRALRRASAGMQSPKRPLGSFIFLGPTGVGKTELCRALGEAMFGDEDAVIRLDMSEYMEKHTVSRMVGSPPGYVGYDEGGQLTEAVRRKPYSVVLFDEVEKAHPDVFNMLLQILEDGRLTDNMGKTTNFRNTIIVLTSNLGAQAIFNSRAVGFGKDANALPDYETMRNHVLEETKKQFRPEFINRLDEIIVFHALSKDETKEIAKIMLSQVDERLALHGITIAYDEKVLDFLAEEGYDPKLGARPMRRAIQRLLEDPLSDYILAGGTAKNIEA
ncbi:MAG: ATP-dependent Clp protease ATP-binding subunit, partial [Christensenellales bacterium]